MSEVLRRRPRPSTWAKVVLGVGLAGFAATASRYFPLRAEETEFDQAPTCVAGQGPNASCRRTVDATVVSKSCDDSVYARSASFAKCELMLDVKESGARLRMPLVLELYDAKGIDPGADLKVELYQGWPEAIQQNGAPVRRMGGRVNAAHSVRTGMFVSAGMALLGLLGWVMMARRERKKI